MARAKRSRLGAHARLPPAVCGAGARAGPAARRRVAARARPAPPAPPARPAPAPAGAARPHQDTNTDQAGAVSAAVAAGRAPA